MTSILISTSAVSSASQYSTETLLTMLDRPSTSLSQPVDSRSFEVIISSEDPTVTTRSYPRLCDPAAVTLPLHSTHLEQFGTHEKPASFGIQFVSPLSGHSPGPPVLSPPHLPQQPISHQHPHHTNRPELYNRETVKVLHTHIHTCTYIHTDGRTDVRNCAPLYPASPTGSGDKKVSAKYQKNT